MNQKLRLGLIIGTVVIILAATGSLFYYKSKSFETCDKALERFDSNHLCISTNKGTMIFKLRPESGPNAVERMTFLANDKKFFDGLEFYRVVKDFVVQGGIQGFKQETVGVTKFDSSTQEKLNEYDNKFIVEANLNQLGLSAEEISKLTEEGYVNDQNVTSKPFEFGDLSFANAGYDSNSSEIFIVGGKDKDSENIKFLNGKFTNFASIVEGQNVLEELNGTSVDSTTDAPLNKIKIIEIRVKS